MWQYQAFCQQRLAPDFTPFRSSESSAQRVQNGINIANSLGVGTVQFHAHLSPYIAIAGNNIAHAK